MADAREFFVYFPGELTVGDLVALDRPGFALYENGLGVSEPFWRLEGCDDPGIFQVVRVPADGALEAQDRVVHALGRNPRDLKVWEPPE